MSLLIAPNWTAPANIIAAMTTRQGGVSSSPFDSLNLGYATADQRDHVYENERRVAKSLGIEAKSIRWVYQVHGNVVHHAERLPENAPLGATEIQGDAIVSRTQGLVCGVKVADCMPVLFAAEDGSAVGAAHAGWRGMSSGVIENTVQAMRTPLSGLCVWLGPCIGATKFEVGEDVRDCFLANATAATRSAICAAFVPIAATEKFLCDLAQIARVKLADLGVVHVVSSGHCTMSEPDLFFSHRRDRDTGRMAAFIGIR